MKSRAQKHSIERSTPRYKHDAFEEYNDDDKMSTRPDESIPPRQGKLLKVVPIGHYEDTSDDDKLEEQSVSKRPRKQWKSSGLGEGMDFVPPPPALVRQSNDFLFPAPPPPLLLQTTSHLSSGRVPSAGILRQTSTKGSLVSMLSHKSSMSNGSTAWELDCLTRTTTPPHCFRNVSDCSAIPPHRPHNPLPELSSLTLEFAQPLHETGDEWTAPGPSSGLPSYATKYS